MATLDNDSRKAWKHYFSNNTNIHADIEASKTLKKSRGIKANMIRDHENGRQDANAIY